MPATRDLIRADRLPHTTARATEITLRKATYRVETVAVQRLQTLYRVAYNDLQALLAQNPHQSSAGRAAFEAELRQRLERLRVEALALLAHAAYSAYLGNYFGRIWQIDMVAHPAATITLQSPPAHPALTDTQTQQIGIELDGLGIDVRRALLAAALSLNTAAALQRRVRDAMGMGTTGQRADFHAHFARVQTLTRTWVQSAAAEGAQDAYSANAPLLDGLEWVTADDELVCPRCLALDGKRLPVNASFRPPIHLCCRCQLTPVLKATAQGDASTPPRMPLRLWIQRWGLDGGAIDEYVDAK